MLHVSSQEYSSELRSLVKWMLCKNVKRRLSIEDILCKDFVHQWVRSTQQVAVHLRSTCALAPCVCVCVCVRACMCCVLCVSICLSVCLSVCLWVKECTTVCEIDYVTE